MKSAFLKQAYLKNEMMRLKNIIQPSIGIFTNIGQAHSENFESLKEKTKEKASLFTEVEKLVLL